MPLCLHYVPRKTGLSFESTPSHASLFAENIGLNSVEASLFPEYKLHQRLLPYLLYICSECPNATLKQCVKFRRDDFHMNLFHGLQKK